MRSSDFCLAERHPSGDGVIVRADEREPAVRSRVLSAYASALRVGGLTVEQCDGYLYVIEGRR